MNIEELQAQLADLQGKYDLMEKESLTKDDAIKELQNNYTSVVEDNEKLKALNTKYYLQISQPIPQPEENKVVEEVKHDTTSIADILGQW